MNPNTGEIKPLKDLTQEQKKTWIKIPKKQLPIILGMNRKARRRWAKQQRKKYN